MFTAHRQQILIPEVQAAFDELLALFNRLPEYEARPHQHGDIKWAIHLRRKSDGRKPFGLLVSQKYLRFYFRRPKETNPHLTLAELGFFPKRSQQKNGEISVRITSVEHARKVAKLAFPLLNIEAINPDEFEIGEGQEYWEGAVRKVFVNAFERNGAAREACINKWGYACAVCGFNFEKVYGERGKNFIHVHHLKPLSEIRAEYRLNPEEDLRPVCPNCHAMLHRFAPAISIDELQKAISK